MTRSELINEIANSVDLTKVDTRQVVMAYEAIVGKTLRKGENVSLIGFGKFSVINRAARSGYNPRSGERMAIPEKRFVKFKVGKQLANVVL